MKAYQRAGIVLFTIFWSLTLIGLFREIDPIVCGGLGVLAILFGALFVMGTP